MRRDYFVAETPRRPLVDLFASWSSARLVPAWLLRLSVLDNAGANPVHCVTCGACKAPLEARPPMR